MESKRRTFLSLGSSELHGRWLRSRWLWAVVMLLGVFTSAQAQTKDIITFSGGYTDPNYPGVYFIDPDSVITPDEEEGRWPYIILTLNRPQGATATREASITLNNIFHWDEEGTTVTFEPGETTATVELSLDTYNEEAVFMLPTIYGVLRTNHADAGFEALVIKTNYTGTPEEADSCTYTSQWELLQEYAFGYNDIYNCFRWGEYIVFRVDWQNFGVKVTADSRLVLKTRYTDHKGLAIDADDYGMSKTREVVLTPINAGTVSSTAMYLYKPKDDEYLYSYHGETSTMTSDNRISNPECTRVVDYSASEIGPFEVANPAEGAITNIFLSRTDLGNDFHFGLCLYPRYFQPTFSNVSINKTTFKSGETMVITATMDNWHLMKRARLDDFANSFGVTLDGTTIEPRRYDFDESTGIITYYVTAPVVDSVATINVEFGATKLEEEYIEEEEGIGDWHQSHTIFTGSEGAFTVTVQSEAATPVPATSIDFVDMPADGSDIAVESDPYYSTYLWERVFSLAIACTPADATDANTVTYSVENVDGTGATINYSDSGEPTLSSGIYAGTIVVKATLASGVSTQRTYNVTTQPTRVVHTTNTYLAGTTLPKFQFEVSGFDQLRHSWDWTAVNDSVTVNYTHANGTKWTEHYRFRQLPSTRKVDDNTWSLGDWSGMSKMFDLPFVFTPDHPDATMDQIGQTIVTAEVLMNMQNASGNRIKVVSTASLEPQLKDLSFKGYTSYKDYYHYLSDPTISSEVMFLPTSGFSVGYEIPELGVREVYDNRSGDPVPDWLELQSDLDSLYTTATLKIHPVLDRSQSYNLSLYTLAQRTCIADEVTMRELTCNVNFSPIQPEGNMVYRVNGQNVTDDLTFDNATDIEAVINKLKTDGFIKRDNEGNCAEIDDIFNQMKAYFTVYDNIFEGADVTLTREGDNDTIQTLTHYKGTFTFAPPADGRTYIIDVFYPAFNKHYKSTFTSHPLTGIRAVALNMTGKYYDGIGWAPNDYVFTYTNDSIEYNIPFSNLLFGFLYAEDADEFYLTKDGEEGKAHVYFPEQFQPIIYNNSPELKTVERLLTSWEAETGYADRYYLYTLKKTYENPTASWRQRVAFLNWDKLMQGATLITLLDKKGVEITNATLNYACVDENLSNPTKMGTATYNAALGGYQIDTDPSRYAELIEVLIPGRTYPILKRMNLYNYPYLNSTGKMRQQTLVLLDNDEELSEATLESLECNGSYSRRQGFVNADVVYKDLLNTYKYPPRQYSSAADYPTVRKFVKDWRYGRNYGAYPYDFAHITAMVHSDDIQSLDRYSLYEHFNRRHLAPDTTFSKVISKDVFTVFTTNHVFLDYNISTWISHGHNAHLYLERDGHWLSDLGDIKNSNVDLIALAEENQFDQGIQGADLTQVDNEIEASGTDMNGTGKAFDKFKFSTPPTIPFTMDIERDGDVFTVRGIYTQNMLPTSMMSDLMDAAAYAEWFDDQFQECMNAVNSARTEIDDINDRLRELKKMPDVFMGIKGYISGKGKLNPMTGKLEVVFNDGGIILEASAHVMYKMSFLSLVNLGIALDVGVAAKMGVSNNEEAHGIDILTEARFYLDIGAWIEACLDAKLAEAKAGVLGTAGIDIRTGAIMPTYWSNMGRASGSMYNFHFDLSVYVSTRALCFKWGDTYTLLKGSHTILDPDDRENPYHPNFYGGDILLSRTFENVTQNYKKLSRKTRRILEGNRLIDNVSGMAQPTYMFGGQSLLFNNLKTPGDYNDDRLQIYDGSKSDFVDTGVDAPMYGFAEAHGNNMEVVAFEQLNDKLNAGIIDATDEYNQLKMTSEMSEIHVAWRKDGGEWNTKTLGSMSGSACINPVVAVSKEDLGARAAVIWQQGKAEFSDNGTRYIEGSLMISRWDGYQWTDPMEIMRINRRNVPVEYKMTIKNDRGYSDSIFVAMTVRQDINNLSEPPKLVYLTVTPPDGYPWNYQVHTYYTNKNVNMLQMERVLDPNSALTSDGVNYSLYDGANLLAYMEDTDDGRNLRLTAVDMDGKPTGKLDGSVGMVSRTMNDFQLVVDDEARDLSDVAILWSQSDQETTDNGDGTATVNFKNRIYASKLCSEDKQIYLSSPIPVATIESANEQMMLASMDGYLDGLDLKVAYCAANSSDAAAVREVNVAFDNDIEHTASFNPYDVKDNENVPLTITVKNMGYEVIDKIEVTMGGETTTYDVRVLPMEKTELKAVYTVADNFDGTIDYEVVAYFTAGNTNALKARGKRVAGRAHRVPQSGSTVDVRQVDLALNLLSATEDSNEKNTIVAEVNNISLLPMAGNMTVKVGLYKTPLVDENAVSVAEVTLTAADLYDAATKENKNKIISLTIDQPDDDQTLYLCTVPMVGSDVVKDVRPLNNVVVIDFAGKIMTGDVNNDKKVDVSDYIGVANSIMGNTPDGFKERAADVNGDGIIDVSDYIGVANIIMTGSASRRQQQTRINRNGIIE